MSIVTWPVEGLPQNFQQSGFTESSGNNIIETQMASGPYKRRRRTTQTNESVNASMIMSSTERSNFIAFHRERLMDGVHPVKFTLGGGELIAFILSYSISSMSGTQFSVSLNMRRTG